MHLPLPTSSPPKGFGEVWGFRLSLGRRAGLQFVTNDLQQDICRAVLRLERVWGLRATASVDLEPSKGLGLGFGIGLGLGLGSGFGRRARLELITNGLRVEFCRAVLRVERVFGSRATAPVDLEPSKGVGLGSGIRLG